MTNYNTLLKAELIALLEKRDTSIKMLETQITNVEKEKEEYLKTLEEVQQSLQECQENIPDPPNEIKTADQIIEAISTLSKEEISLLPIKIRTTDKGIEAFTAFIYGGVTNPS